MRWNGIRFIIDSAPITIRHEYRMEQRAFEEESRGHGDQRGNGNGWRGGVVWLGGCFWGRRWDKGGRSIGAATSLGYPVTQSTSVCATEASTCWIITSENATETHCLNASALERDTDSQNRNCLHFQCRFHESKIPASFWSMLLQKKGFLSGELSLWSFNVYCLFIPFLVALKLQ